MRWIKFIKINSKVRLSKSYVINSTDFISCKYLNTVIKTLNIILFSIPNQYNLTKPNLINSNSLHSKRSEQLLICEYKGFIPFPSVFNKSDCKSATGI